MCVSGGKKYYFFGKFSLRNKLMIPYQEKLKLWVQIIMSFDVATLPYNIILALTRRKKKCWLDNFPFILGIDKMSSELHQNVYALHV